MKTKANILIEDGQDIKVKEVVTDEIMSSDNKVLLKFNKVNNQFVIGNYEISQLNITSVDSISMNVEDYGGISFNEDGLTLNLESNYVITVDSAGIYFDKPTYFSKYTTALRPTEDLDEGAVIYDSTLKKCILWNGLAWVNLDGTALE